MISIYRPTRIIEARQRVEAEHTKTARGKATADDKILKSLILRIAALAPGEVEAFLRGVSDRQIHQISEYVCLNFWKVDLKNLLTAISLRGDVEEWECVYSGWQKHYDQGADCETIRRFLGVGLAKNTALQRYVQGKQWSLISLMWISQDDYINRLCAECVKRGNLYRNGLMNHGVLPDTALWDRCMIVYYLQADRNELISLGAAELKVKYLTWTMADKKQFCRNLYEKLGDADLAGMRELLTTLDKDFDEKTMKGILSERGYQLYQVWLNFLAVEKAFSGYEDRNRRKFWMKYIRGNSFRNYAQTFVIDFGAYVAVEFKGKAAGPAYVYKKEFFQRTVAYKMHHLSKIEFQKWEYEKYQEHADGVCERMPHTDNWMYRFSNRLRSYGIEQSYR